MYSNNIPNFQESTTILKLWKSIESTPYTLEEQEKFSNPNY